MPAERQVWERAEIVRSAVEARNTPESRLKADERNLARYLSPPADTVFPLEYSFAAIGDVRGRTVLDFGCGSGENSLVLARRGARVVGVDLSESLLRLARRRLEVNGVAEGARFVAGSAHDLPLAARSVDLVLGIAILHHLDLDLVSKEVRRVLKPGGRAIFQEPVRNSAVIRFLRSLIPYRAPDISPYERPLTDAELQRFANGFSRWSVRAFGLPHVQLGPLLPIVKKFWRTLYAWDRGLLDRAPALARYASIRVISLTK